MAPAPINTLKVLSGYAALITCLLDPIPELFQLAGIYIVDFSQKLGNGQVSKVIH